MLPYSKLERALIIEDDLADFELVKSKLPPGVDVTRATSIKDFLTLHDKIFDVVICDLGLPDADGERAIISLRKIMKYTGIVVCTANYNLKEFKRCLAAGANSYIVKDGMTQATLDYAIQSAMSFSRINRKIDESEQLLKTV